MLRCMRQTAPSHLSPTSQSFAGLLATLASPSREAADVTTGLNENDLGDDVVMLSYERALRAHARYKPAEASVCAAAQPQPKKAGKNVDSATHPAARTDECETHSGGLTSQAGEAPQSANDRDLRSVSVTIRLSKAECERLHLRAAEAGITVSAYMRSCTFEAERLRAQVKEALAELKATGKGTREQGRKGASQRGNAGFELTRIFGHIGKLVVGLSTDRSA